MSTTPGQIAKFDQAGNVTDSIITETGGSIGIGTPTPGVRTQLEGTSDPEATLAIRRSDKNKFVRLGAGSIGVALDFDPTSVLVIQKNTSGVGGHLDGPELLRVTPDGHVGIGTPSPVTPLHVTGNLTLDTGDSPVVFTGTANNEQNRYLQLINSPAATSASGLKAGGILVADGYNYANPGKNDLIVKGNVGIGTANPVAKLDVQGDIRTPHVALTSNQNGGIIVVAQANNNEAAALGTNAAGGGAIEVVADNGHIIFQLTQNQSGGGDLRLIANNGNPEVMVGQNTGNGGIVSVAGINGNEAVRISTVVGFPDNGFVGVTDSAGAHTARMSFDTNGNSIVQADVKSFSMPHPTQPETDIVYACIEGPEAAVFVRGTAHLVQGEASVSLPDHFVHVANPDTMTIQVTPLSADSMGLAVVAKGLAGFVVRELQRGSGNYDFDWDVKCARRGHEDYRVTRPRSEMTSLGGLAPQAAMEMRARLTSPPEGRRPGETP